MAKIFKALLTAFFMLCICSQANAINSVKIVIAPLNIPTVESGYEVYPNIEELFSSNIVNQLGKNIRFDVIDFSTAENLLMSNGIYEDYKNFLKKYKDTRVIDSKACFLLSQKAEVDSIVLVSSGFSFQNLILKEPLLARLGIIEVDPVKSYYRLDTEITLLDTHSCSVKYSDVFQTAVESKDFDVPSRSFGDNAIFLTEIQKFSDEVAYKSVIEIIKRTKNIMRTQIKTNTSPTLNTNYATEGATTRDGQPFSANNQYLQEKRKQSYINWIKKEPGI